MPDLGHKSSQRVKKPGSFTAAIRKGLFLRGSLLNIWVIRLSLAGLSANEDARPAVGIMVSRKVHLRAVKRNLWKRRIREAFRRNQTELQRGWAVVVQARRQEQIPAFSEIQKEFLRLCARADILIKK